MGAVSYTLDIVDDIPERERPVSPLENALEQIKDASAKQGKPITAVIGFYKNGSACTAAANVLRQKHGTPDVEGFRFETRRVNRPVKDEQGNDTDQTEEVTALYVNYDAGKVVEGARAAWDTKMAERARKLEAKRIEREAAKAAEGNGSGAAPSATPTTTPTDSTPTPPAPPANSAANPATAGMTPNMEQGATPPQGNDGGKTPQAPAKPKAAEPNAKK